MVRLLRRKGVATFAFLVVLAEVVGRSLTGHVDRALHVEPLARTSTSYYPFLLAGVKVVGALVLAGLLGRATRAWAAADAGGRVLAAIGHGHEHRSPKLRPRVSARIWFFAFASTSVVYLLHMDIEGMASGRWPVLAPWLHTNALPVFAVLAVVVAIAWRFASWIYEVEEYAVRTLARCRRLLAAFARFRTLHPRPTDDGSAPRRRFGLSFECRPPPSPA
ncbi:MAG: hypothetical protein ACJ76I_15310 [Gaiellaceae bacterium]